MTDQGDAMPGPGMPSAPTVILDRPRVHAPRRPRLTYRRDIDGLRAIAVVLVVLFHAGLGAVPGGFVGVDVFFVISGFLITALLVDELDRSGTVSLSAFYARRVRRLLPLSALVLVVSAFASAAILVPLAHQSVADDIRAAALWMSNWHFAAGSTQYMASTAQSPVLHYWSLSLEEQFYVVWPLIILLVVRSAGRWSPMARRRLATSLGAVLATTLLMSILLTSSLGPWAYFGLQTRAWELALGAALSMAVARLVELPLAIAGLAGWAGLGLITWSAVTFDRTTVYPGIAAVVPVVGAGLVLASGARTRGAGAAGLLSHPALVHVGKLSYGWYLWHWPLLVMAGALAPIGESDGLDDVAPQTPVTYVVVALVLSYVLAEVSHRWVEDPARTSAWFSASRTRSLTLGAALTVTSVLIATIALPTSDAAVEVSVAAPAAAGASAAGAASAGGAKAVASSPVTVAAPKPMTPAQARVDGSAPTACYLGYAATTADLSCRFGDPHGSKVIALVGDSHAAMWLPALDKAAKAQGWQVWMWSKSACPMTEVGIYLPAFTSRYAACDAWRADVLRRLAALPQLDSVLVVRSKGYANGLVLDANGNTAAAADLPALWEKGTRDLLAQLTPHAANVTFLRDTPWSLTDVPDCLSAHLSDPSSCALSRTQRQHLDPVLVASETSAAAGTGGVRFIDATKLVCPKAICLVVTPTGIIVFRDQHHLTKTFSATLAAAFARLIAPSMGT